MGKKDSYNTPSYGLSEIQVPVGVDPQHIYKNPSSFSYAEGSSYADEHVNKDHYHDDYFENISKSSLNTPSMQIEGSGAVYAAVYSSVPVYEMMCNNVAVMRRQKDSFLNATQVLKVANIDKGKRTKILEKEIQNGDHEKVQGGYGKYQGTWYDFLLMLGFRSKEVSN